MGMNMGLSIKFWLKSFQIVDHKSFKVTKIGQKIFDEQKGIDPYLEDDSTIWLLHWLLCSNPRATLLLQHPQQRQQIVHMTNLSTETANRPYDEKLR